MQAHVQLQSYSYQQCTWSYFHTILGRGLNFIAIFDIETSYNFFIVSLNFCVLYKLYQLPSVAKVISSFYKEILICIS